MAKLKSAKKGAVVAKKAVAKAVVKGKAAKKGAASRKKPAPAALSVEEKQRLLKPITGFGDLIERLSTTWKEHGGRVKVPGMTPAKLGSLLRKAERASKREEAVRTTLEAKLQPLADARLKAEHEAWKSALDLYAMVKTAARTDPAIAMPFEFFAEALAKRRAGAGAGAAANGAGAGTGAGAEKTE